MNSLVMRNARTTNWLQQPITLSRYPSVSSIASRASSQFRNATTSSTSLLEKDRSPINAPLSTFPAPLSLPTRDPNQSFFPKHALALGKAYLAFYKAGVKNIYANYKASQPIRSEIYSQYKGSQTAAIKDNALSRADFQLLRRSWFDLKRVPIFALVFLVCGEFTPLIVIAITGVVPWTCRIPTQIEGDRMKMEKRRSISFRNLTLPPPENEGVDALQRMQLLHISWSLGLSSSAWDWLGGQLPGLPTGVLRKKVAARKAYLELDDGLISRYGGVKKMDGEEVKLACVERGIDVVGKKDEKLRERLELWLKARQKTPIERLLLTRPSVWPKSN